MTRFTPLNSPSHRRPRVPPSPGEGRWYLAWQAPNSTWKKYHHSQWQNLVWSMSLVIALDSQEIPLKPQQPPEVCKTSPNREMQAAGMMDRIGGQIRPHGASPKTFYSRLRPSWSVTGVQGAAGMSLKVLPHGGQHPGAGTTDPILAGDLKPPAHRH